MADSDEWVTNANDVVRIHLVQPDPNGLRSLSTFSPKFTYPIFGEDEKIFGYQGLKIDLRFAAHNLYPNVDIHYDSRFKTIGDTEAVDIEKVLEDFLPSYAFGKTTTFKSKVKSDESAKSFRPPGKLLESYSRRGRKYEIWSAELMDPAVQLLLERMQIFVSFFIEAGTPIPLKDQEWSTARWRVFFLYEKLSTPPTPTASSYAIVGYSTSYKFLPPKHTGISNGGLKSRHLEFPLTESITIASIPSRPRISQFLILPPHQGHSHGTHLYVAMIKVFLADPTSLEITVEDPNEAFDDLRDYCDFARLAANGTLDKLRLNTNLDAKTASRRIGGKVPTAKLLDLPLLHSLRLQNKLAERQFFRLVEMYLLSKIPLSNRQSGTARLTQRGKAKDEGDRAYYYWRLLVKQRIYRKNKDVLIQLDRLERIDKLEETLGGQQGDYERLLRNIVEKASTAEDESYGNGSSERRQRGKRKIVDDDDDDDDEDDEDDESAGMEKRRASKRVKSSDEE